MDEQEDTLAELRQQLCQEDAVMEAGVLANIKLYIANGGKPQEVVASLANGYRGYAEMSNLLSEWLLCTDVPREHIENMVKETVTEHVRESFEAKTADTIFDAVSATPEWLEWMIKDEQWRKVLYQLAEEHEGCLMLSFAMQKISEAGHHAEIASCSSATGNFYIFNRVLHHMLLEVATIDDVDADHVFETFKNLCCASEQTYVYAQAVLYKLRVMCTDRSLRSRFDRAAQELERFVTQHRCEDIGIKVPLYLSSAFAWPSSLVVAIIALKRSRKCTPGDIMKLHTLYWNAKSPPPVGFIRDPVILDILVKELFARDAKIPPKYVDKYIEVLAYAVSAVDPCDVTSEPNTTETRDIDKSDVAGTVRALKTARRLCHQLPGDIPSSAAEFEKQIEYPVAAMCLVEWASKLLTDPSFYSSTFANAVVPILLHLLRLITFVHPQQHAAVFRVLCLAFETDTEQNSLQDLDFKRSLLDSLLYMVHCGYVIMVLKRVATWCARIDQSLIRYFLLRVLKLASPPYSISFAGAMVDILKQDHTVKALKGKEIRELAIGFVDAIVAAGCDVEGYSLAEVERLRNAILKSGTV